MNSNDAAIHLSRKMLLELFERRIRIFLNKVIKLFQISPSKGGLSPLIMGQGSNLARLASLSQKFPDPKR
jgi:hypothetical protein